MPPRHTRPLSQVEIEERIQDDLDALEEATEVYREMSERAAKAEVAFKVARAGAYLRSRGTIKDREFNADYLTKEEAIEYKMSEGLLKSQRELLSTIRTRVDALRTLSANVRQQV